MTEKVKGGCVPIEYLVLGVLENNVYIISDGAGAVVVDPTCKAERIAEALAGRRLDAIVLTHRHADHVGGAAKLREISGAPVIASAIDAPVIRGEKKLPRAEMGFIPCPVDQGVEDGDTLAFGNMAWKVMLTPGHTEGGICLFLDSRYGSDPSGAPVLVSGDTLFFGTIGRTDFVGGDMAAMRRSLKRLAALPDQTIVLPGHSATTTIGAERSRVFDLYA